MVANTLVRGWCSFGAAAWSLGALLFPATIRAEELPRLPAVRFVGLDTQTQGDWPGRYGELLYVLCGAREYNLVGGTAWPLPIALESGDPSRRAWPFISSLQSDDPRGLWNPFHGRRTLSAVTAAPRDLGPVARHGKREPLDPEWLETMRRTYERLGSELIVRLDASAGEYRLGLYFVDGLVSQPVEPSRFRVTVSSRGAAAAAELADFRSGVYLLFRIRGPGPVVVRIERVEGLWATLSGVFLDPFSEFGRLKPRSVFQGGSESRGLARLYQQGLDALRSGRNVEALNVLGRLVREAPRSDPKSLLARLRLQRDPSLVALGAGAPFEMTARERDALSLSALTRAELLWWLPHWTRAQIETFRRGITDIISGWETEKRNRFRRSLGPWLSMLVSVEPGGSEGELALEETYWRLESFSNSPMPLQQQYRESEESLQRLFQRPLEAARQIEGLDPALLDQIHARALSVIRSEQRSAFSFASHRFLTAVQQQRVMEDWERVTSREIDIARTGIRQIPAEVSTERRADFAGQLALGSAQRLYESLQSLINESQTPVKSERMEAIERQLEAERRRRPSLSPEDPAATAGRLYAEQLFERELLLWNWFPWRVIARIQSEPRLLAKALPHPRRAEALARVDFVAPRRLPASYRFRFGFRALAPGSSYGSLLVADMQIVARLSRPSSVDFLRESVGATWQVFPDCVVSYSPMTEKTTRSASFGEYAVLLEGGDFQAADIAPWIQRLWDNRGLEIAPGRVAGGPPRAWSRRGQGPRLLFRYPDASGGALAEYEWSGFRRIGRDSVPTRLQARFESGAATARVALNPLAVVSPLRVSNHSCPN